MTHSSRLTYHLGFARLYRRPFHTENSVASRTKISQLRRQILRVLVATTVSIWGAGILAGCSVAPRPEPTRFAKPELAEQNVELVSLTLPDILQILFDEMSRVSRIASIASQASPAGEVAEGCLTYVFRPADRLTVIDFACSGREPRRDLVSMDRDVAGEGIVRTTDDVSNYVASLDVRRYRPTAPGKTVRYAKIDHSILIAAIAGDDETAGPSLRSFEATSRFLGQRAAQLPRAETWESKFIGELDATPASTAAIATSSTMNLTYAGEDGATISITAIPRERVTFSNGELSRCLRPIGRFTMRITSDGPSGKTTTEAVYESSASGFGESNSTSVVPWPTSCLENVAARVEEN